MTMKRASSIDRRSFLRRGTTGAAALHALLCRAAAETGSGLLAPRPTHHPARARRLLVVFLTGGFSHLDTFDPKPELARRHGQAIPSSGLRPDETGFKPLLASPFRFTPRGQSGLMISELFPRFGAMADDLCVIRSMHTDIVEHFQAVLAMHTGSATVPLPSLGSWLSYRLGTENPNLPSYVVLCENLPYAGMQGFSSGFLPPIHQGARVIPGPHPIPNLAPPSRPLALHELERKMLADVEEHYARKHPGDARVRDRRATFEVARGMMQEAPQVFDVCQEPALLRGLWRGPW